LGFRRKPSERSLYRTLEIIGKCLPILLEKYQKGFKEAWFNSRLTNLRHNITSTYFEGDGRAFCPRLFKRQKTDKKQVKIGVAWE